MKKVFLSLIIAGTIAMFACKKDPSNNNNDDVDVSNMNNKQIIMSHPWIMTSWVDSNTSDYKAYEQLEACSKDDYYTFRDTDVLIDEKSNICSGNSPTRTSEWYMASPTETKITLFNVFTFDIKSISDKQMTLLRVFRQTTDTLFTTVKFVKP